MPTHLGMQAMLYVSSVAAGPGGCEADFVMSKLSLKEWFTVRIWKDDGHRPSWKLTQSERVNSIISSMPQDGVCVIVQAGKQELAELTGSLGCLGDHWRAEAL